MRYNIALSALLLGVSAIVSCKNETTKVPTKKIEVPVLTIEPKSFALDHLYVADIRAIRNVEMRNKVSGFLEAIYVDEGQTVVKGQILFRIGDNEYKAEVTKAKAILNNIKAEARVTELEYERVKTLVDKNIVAKTELDLAAAKLQSARARTEEAQSAMQNATHRLSYTVIRAPFDGIVDRIDLKAGSLLNEGTLLTSVSDISKMYAYFDVSENEYLSYSRKMAKDGAEDHRSANLVLSDGQNYEYTGKIETVVSEFDANTGSISFRASFPNPRQMLKHRATGKIRLSTNVEQTLVIPQKASFEIQDKNYVYALDAANVVKMKSFVPSGRIDGYYIIKSGLRQGDRIVYEGIQDLREGMTVSPQTIPTDSLPLISAVAK